LRVFPLPLKSRPFETRPLRHCIHAIGYTSCGGGSTLAITSAAAV
jgi:hypothetical protein